MVQSSEHNEHPLNPLLHPGGILCTLWIPLWICQWGAYSNNHTHEFIQANMPELLMCTGTLIFGYTKNFAAHYTEYYQCIVPPPPPNPNYEA